MSSSIISIKEKEHEGSILFGLPSSRQQKFLVLRFVFDVKEQQGIDWVKVLEFFDFLGPRQGVEDLRELLHKGAQKDRKAEVFQVSNDDTTVAQRRLEDKQSEEKTNTDCIIKEKEKVHYGVDVGAVIMKIKVLGQEGAKGNDAEMYREDNNEAAFVAGLKEDMDIRSDVYVLSNGCRKSSDDNHDYYWKCKANIWVTKGLLVKAKGNILGLEIFKDQSDNTLRVSQSKIHNKKFVHNLLKGYSTLSLEDSLSGDSNVEKNTNVQVFVDFNYAMGRSITVMSRSITGYGLMKLRCAGSLKTNLQHMEALSTTKAGYMTFTEAWKKEIWLKEVLTESGYELRLVAGSRLQKFLVLRFVFDIKEQQGIDWVKVLEFFDFLGPRQGVEDLRELLHKGAQRDREADVFQVSNDDTAVAQRRLEDKQSEGNTNTNCMIKEKDKAGLKEDMDIRSDVYVLSNDCRKSSDDNHDYYWKYAPTKGNILGLEIFRDQSDNTLRVSQSKIHNKKFIHNLLKGYSTLSLEDSLSGDCDVEKNHMEALSTTKAGYMTFTEAWKKEIWLKGLLTESGYELRLVAGIATGALVKGCSRSEVPAQVWLLPKAREASSDIDSLRSASFRTRNRHIAPAHTARTNKEYKQRLWKVKNTRYNVELRSMFAKQAGVKRFDLIQTFHACKQEEGKSVGSYVLKMKGNADQLERLGYVLPQDLSVGLIFNGLTIDFAGFVRNYNMHNKGKTIDELHALLIEYEKGLPKKAATPQVMVIQGGKIQKANKKSLKAKGKAHHLVENGFVQRLTNYEISVSKNDVLYFNVISSNDIYEIDMSNLVPNINSIYNVINKRVKHNLDSTYLWHCLLSHISKKRIEKIQHDGLLKSTDDESFDQCESCLSGKMTRKSFSRRLKRETDLLGLIHTDVYEPLRHVSRHGASYFITFMDYYNHYGYIYFLKHKHEVFETFKVFKNEVENQLGKTIKALRSYRGEINLLSFIQTVDLTKVRIGERQRDEDEPKLLETIVGRIVSLLPAAPDRSSGELDASVDKLFDEGGSGEQAEQGVGIQLVSGGEEFVAKDEVSLQPRQKKRKTVVLVLNAEVRGDPIPTLPFVTSSVSATPEREGEGHTDSVTRLNLRTIGAPPSVPVLIAATTVTPTAGPAMVKEKIVKPSLFSVNLPQLELILPWVVLRIFLAVISSLVVSALLSALTRIFRRYEFSPPKFFASIHGMEHDQLFTEFNVGAAQQMSLSADESEVLEAIRLHAKAFKFEAIERSLQGARLCIWGFAFLSLLLTYLCIFARLHVHELEDAQLKFVNDKFDKLYTDFVEMALHLEERFYPHLLTTIAGHMWLLTYGMELAVAKYLNSSEYLSALGTAIDKAIEKGMQDGLAAGITHGKEGRFLADVTAYNPFAAVDYVFALPQLQSVNFSLLTELKLNKDSSVETLMNILHLEETVAERLGLNETQPHVDKLMVPIHHSPDQTVIGATALSLSLNVSHAHVQKIRENITNYRSTLRDVFIPLAEPFSAMALKSRGGTSDTVPVTDDTTTTLYMVVASTSTARPISIDDYKVAGTDDQATADGNVTDKDANPCPNVDGVELNVPE
uniref:GAG-pre-integrase domain-containing protein n=1 Tax=Tanacetum cinerariifolium TaxID=118510 RepID=A0A6L2K4T9_TANCI|nr:hypothetical protein [Tanacetum cinerariifolium]